MTIESFSAFWTIAFVTDFALGSLSFYFVTSKLITERYQGLGWWMGWWSFADAIALTLNAIMGTDYFWSYHQIGILSDTAINMGLVWFLLKWLYDNWALNDEDWDKIRKIRNDAKIRELSK